MVAERPPTSCYFSLFRLIGLWVTIALAELRFANSLFLCSVSAIALVLRSSRSFASSGVE